MKAPKLIFLISLVMAIIMPLGLDAQINPGRILRNTKKKAEKKVEERVEKRVDKAVDKTLDKAEDAIDGKGQGAEAGKDPATASPESNPAAIAATRPVLNWDTFDFLPGDVVIFEDNLQGERNGEFPSKWDLVNGSVENAVFDDENVIMYINTNTNIYGGIVPLMTNNEEDYLPSEFTYEFDAYFDSPQRTYRVLFYDGKNQGRLNSSVNSGSSSSVDRVRISQNSADFGSTEGYYPGFNSNNQSSSPAGWRRISISFNKRALKVYLDDARVLNIPNVSYNPLGITMAYHNPGGGHQGYIKNIRIAQGAVPLYDKFLTDGKIVTSGIRFDVNRATIRPESMGVINEIVNLLKQNPELRFSVEGHTDSDGNPASNQTLSEERAKAVVEKMVELGISPSRLTSKGHGQSQPIAPNSTPEGKAQNRRVEFVKM
jgi:outer membrane protein OmpA-like peptidoglycan-associated protein